MLRNYSSPVQQQALLETDSFRICAAQGYEQRQQARHLVEKMYGLRGYAAQHGSGVVDDLAERLTVLAQSPDGLPLGTVTIALDGRAGLLADALYPDELQALRSRGARLVELGKLAMERHVEHSRAVLSAMFHATYVYAIQHQATHCVVEVNPRHVGFYENSVGMQRIGALRMCPRVHAPAVLLLIELDYMGRQIQRFGGRAAEALARGEECFYGHFASELGQLRMLRHLQASQAQPMAA